MGADPFRVLLMEMEGFLIVLLAPLLLALPDTLAAFSSIFLG